MAYNSPNAFESISAVTGTPSTELGERRWYDGCEYVYMYNAGNSQIVPTYCFMQATGTAGYSGTVTTTSGDHGMGMVVHATFTTGTYGWALVYGKTDVTMASTNAIGLALSPGAAGLFATYTAGAAICARTLSAVTGTGKAHVNFKNLSQV